MSGTSPQHGCPRPHQSNLPAREPFLPALLGLPTIPRHLIRSPGPSLTEGESQSMSGGMLCSCLRSWEGECVSPGLLHWKAHGARPGILGTSCVTRDECLRLAESLVLNVPRMAETSEWGWGCVWLQCHEVCRPPCLTPDRCPATANSLATPSPSAIDTRRPQQGEGVWAHPEDRGVGELPCCLCLRRQFSS